MRQIRDTEGIWHKNAYKWWVMMLLRNKSTYFIHQMGHHYSYPKTVKV